jgi:hypothetical protein
MDLQRVTTLDEFNLRLWTWVEEYHRQPHSSLSGRTPLEVWESEAEQIRWVEDPSQLEKNFCGEVERLVRNDCTVQWRGVFYEVLAYLRRQRVRLRYALLDSTRVSVLDAETEIPLRPVQPVENANRPRVSTTADASPTRKTGDGDPAASRATRREREPPACKYHGGCQPYPQDRPQCRRTDPGPCRWQRSPHCLSPSSAVLLAGQTIQFSAAANRAPCATPMWLVNKRLAERLQREPLPREECTRRRVDRH